VQAILTWLFYSGVHPSEIAHPEKLEPKLRHYIEDHPIEEIMQGPIPVLNVWLGLPEGTERETYEQLVPQVLARVQERRPDIPEPNVWRITDVADWPQELERAPSLDLEELTGLLISEFNTRWEQIQPLLREAGRPV